jgi:uncharacterized protein YjiS (DUF1127 family)
MDSAPITARALSVGSHGSAGPWNVAFVKVANQLIAWISVQWGTRSRGTELSTLDCRLLADIGLARRRIDQIRRYDRLPKRWCHDDCQ